MAFVSRLVNMFERMLGTHDEDELLEDDRQPGLWMTAGDVTRAAPEIEQPFVDSPVAPPPLVRKVTAQEVAIAPALVPATLLEIEPEAQPDPAVAAEPQAVLEPATPTAFDEPPPHAEEAPEQETTPDESAKLKVIAAANGAPGDGDMLSMFREAASGVEYTHLTKDLEDVTAQELLAEARAVRDLLPGAGSAAPRA